MLPPHLRVVQQAKASPRPSPQGDEAGKEQMPPRMRQSSAGNDFSSNNKPAVNKELASNAIKPAFDTDPSPPIQSAQAAQKQEQKPAVRELPSHPAQSTSTVLPKETPTPPSSVKDVFIRNLQQQLAQANARCNELMSKCARVDELEAEIVELKQELQSSETSFSDSPQEHRGRSTTPRVPNLTGYDSSDDEDSEVEDRQLAITDTAATSPVTFSSDEKFKFVHGILDHFQTDLAKVVQDVATLKVQQGDVKSLSKDNELVDLSERVETLEAFDQIKDFRSWQDSVDAELKRISTAREANNPDDESTTCAGCSELSKRLAQLLKRQARKAEQESWIDEAIIKDTLNSYYRSLSTAIANGETHAGRFKGTSDELWALRHRCVMRLACFDLCVEAAKEAHADWEYNGKRV